MQFKQFGGLVKDVDTSGRRITGYLTAFNNKDKGGDIGVKGMFAKSIMERGPEAANQIKFLYQHNWEKPHGTFAVLKEDDYGLYFESNKLPNTSYSNDTLELYSEGIINEHSYGYEVVRAEFDHEKEALFLQEVKLYEGSNVTLGMNPETPFLGFKSGDTKSILDTINEKTTAMMRMLRKGNVTDDTMIQLEIAVKQLVSFGYELGQKTTLEPTSEVTLEPDVLKQIFNEVRTQNFN